MKRFPRNDNCLETHVSFYLAGDLLNPNVISKVLKTRPSFCVKKGDVHKDRHVKGVKARTGVWFFQTKGKLKSTNLEEHILYLLKKFKRIPPVFYKIKQKSLLDFSVRCFWMSATGHGGPDISSQTLKKVSNLGAKLEFDFYSSV